MIDKRTLRDLIEDCIWAINRAIKSDEEHGEGHPKMESHVRHCPFCWARRGCMAWKRSNPKKAKA